MHHFQSLFLTIALSSLGWSPVASAAPEFKEAYRDKAGLAWSQNMGDSFLDECNAGYARNPCDKNIVFLGSITGTKECELAGSRLPTQDEFQRLLREFDHTETSYGPRLTTVGLEKARQVFSNFYGGFLASSRGSDFTYALNGYEGFMVIEYWDSSTYHFSAICVR